MELNREQIKYALGCCVDGDCYPCPYAEIGAGCRDRMAEDALSLIKELTEENENFEKRLRHLLQSDFIASFDEVNIKTKEYFRDISEADELMDERDRYKRYYFNHCFDELIANKEADIKADTVRKMHSEIEKRCIKGGIYPAFVKSTIDQIAKEMEEAAYE